MGICKFISSVGSWLFSNSSQESGGSDAELEHDDDQPGNKKRKATHDSMVIYDHEQGSSSASSSQPICRSEWLLSYDPAACRMNEALRRKIERLFARAVDVSKELKHEEIQPRKKRRMEVHQWLTNVYRIREELQNLATDGKSIENFISRVDELIQLGNFPRGFVLPDDSPIEFPLPAKNPAGEIFASNIAKILEWLKNNERCIIGVYGMGGVGKTTMLRWLYNEVLKKESTFGRPYWVTVSQNCDEHKLRNEIAKELGVDLSGEGDDRKRAAILHKRLSKMGPIVLFLDDMWKWNPFLGKDIEFPLKDSSCKIILSSRSSKVCQEMGCKDFVIKAKVLSEGEAWNLFVDKLGHYNTLTEEAKEIARSIAKECGGLPLAIATMARSMTEVVDIRVWKSALNELRQSACVQSDMEEYVFSVLKYSYNRLNDRVLQNCFLSCILYPEDYKIEREELIDEWIMEGLLDDAGNRSKQLNKGHTILNKLINSCLLEACTKYGGDECVKMHDLMRDLGIMITKTYPCFMTKSGLGLLEVPEEEQWSKDLVKVSLSWNGISEIPCGVAPPTPKLTLLKLNNNPLTVIPKSFFLHMRSLTVLDLSDTLIVSLPESVSDLENLRALLLAECFELTYVPSVAKLTKLKVLDLPFSLKSDDAPKGIERLKCLEKVSCPWDISDSTGFNKFIQSLPSSTCYRFWLCDQEISIESHVDDSCFEGFDNVVVIGLRIGDDNTTYLLPATIASLTISYCVVNRRSLGDVFPGFGMAKNLQNDTCSGLKYISSSSLGPQQSSFTEDMFLTEMPDLRSIDFGGCSFSRLCRLQIDCCSKVKVIFPLTEKQLLFPNMKHFDVSSCEELEEIFESNNGIQPNSVLALPNLVSLKLRDLPNLLGLYMNLHLCTSLEELYVLDCKELEDIFEGGGSNGSSSSTSQGEIETSVVEPINDCNTKPNPICALPKLKILHLDNLPKLGSIYKDLHLCTSLEKLKVVKCPKIERIFESNDDIQRNHVLTLPNLVSLDLGDLPKLRRLCMNLHQCTSLEVLLVWDCKELEEIFESGGSYNSSPSSQGEAETLVADPMNACNPQPNPISALPKLQDISLGNLPKLGSIYKDLHLCTSLQQLEVVYCPKIEQIFEAPEPILAFHKLRNLNLERLPKLSSIHRGLLFCTSLKEFNIEGCFKLKRVPLSNHLICDNSPSSLLSLPSDSDNPELWKLLRRDYSEDAGLLSDFIQYHVRLEEHNQNQLKLKRKRSDLEDNARDFTGSIDQVSLPASLIPAADEDKNNWLNDQLLLPRLLLTEDEQNQIRSWGASLSLS